MDKQQYGLGVAKVIEEAERLIAQNKANLARMKALKFDTIAVHGIYSIEEAISKNQGAIIEPFISLTPRLIRMPTS